MYAILPGVATLGVAGLVSWLAAHSSARRRQAESGLAGLSPAMPWTGMSWAASEDARPRPRLVVTRFGSDAAMGPLPAPAEGVAVRLDRLRHALDQLTALLLVATSGDDGQARFVANLGDGGGPVDREVAASAMAMRRLGTLMLSASGGEAILVAPSSAYGSADLDQQDSRAIWSDFLAALAFLTGACRRHGSTIHLGEVEATALAIEHLCVSLAKTDLLMGRLWDRDGSGAGRAWD